MSANTSENKHVQASPQVSEASKKPMTPSERRVQVAAARLRVTLDERLGRPTPAKTKALAKEPL